MTWSNQRHWGQHAASHLLYTNLKKDKQQRHERERKQRRKNLRKNKDVNSEEAVQVVVLGLNWQTHLGCCEVHPWVGGEGQGIVGYGLSPQALWKFTLQEHVFVWGGVSVTSSSRTTAVPVCWVSPCLSRLSRPLTSDRNSLLICWHLNEVG